MRRASNIAAMIAVTLVVLGLGGVHTAVAGGAAALALIAACLETIYLRDRGHDVLVSLVGAGLTAAAAACFVQLLPVPAWVHAVFNPTGLSIYETGCELAGFEPTGWRPLSLDPMATADRALRYVALAATAVWAANVRGTRVWGTFAHFFVPLAIVDLAIGFGLQSTKATSFFGLYEPVVGSFRGPSTFLSTNHGAMFFGLAGIVAAATALGLRRDRPRRAAAFGACVPLLVIGALAQDSDGVVLALFAAAAAAVVVQWFRLGRPRKLKTDVKLGIGLLMVLGVIAAVWLDLHLMLGGFLTRLALSGEHGGRFELLHAGFAMLADYWRFGAGAGAVESVLPAYVDWSSIVPASIPLIENDTLEVLVSFGVPLGVLLIAAGLWQLGALVRAGTSGHRSPRYAVAIVTAVYVGLLAQLHFPLFALGIAMPTLIWFELLWSRRRPSTQGARYLTTGHLVLDWRAALAGLCMLAVGAVLSAQTHYTSYRPSAEPSSNAELVREIWRRPASHVAYVKLATRAARAHEVDRALEFANFAVLREPSPRVRLYRAQIVALVDQQRGAESFAELFSEGHTDNRFVSLFLTAVSDDGLRVDVLQNHPEMWDVVATQIQIRDGADAASSFVVDLVSRRPGDVAVYRLAAATYLRLRRPELSRMWAQLAADAEVRESSTEVHAPLLLARALRAAGKVDEARQVLEDAATNPALVRDAHREALTLRGTPNPERVAFVRRHHDVLCVSPVPPADQRLCWSSEAWLLESQNEFTAAEQVFIRLRRRMNDPTPLAEFYLRTGRCDELTALARDVDRGPMRARAEAMSARCVR